MSEYTHTHTHPHESETSPLLASCVCHLPLIKLWQICIACGRLYLITRILLNWLCFSFHFVLSKKELQISFESSTVSVQHDVWK